jgi:tetratricopeptide (TPR) repeat protein
VTVRTANLRIGIALAIAVVCWPLSVDAGPRDAPAADAPAKARAQALLSEGTAAYGRGDYAEALEKFNEAYKIFPSPKLWFNIGQANRDLGRPVEAVEAFDRFLRDAGDDAPPETLAEARRSAAELKTKLGQINVRCPFDGTEITIDGKRVGSVPLGAMVWATPGRHQIAGQLDGHSPALEEVVVEIGQVAAVDIQPRAIDTSIKDARWPKGFGPDAEREPPIYRRGWFWVAVGAVVAVGAITTIIFATGSGDSGGSSGVPETTLGAQRAF